MGIRLWHRVARDWMERRRFVLEAKVHNRLYCLSIRLYQLMYHKYDLVVISIHIGADNSLQLTSNPFQCRFHSALNRHYIIVSNRLQEVGWLLAADLSMATVLYTNTAEHLCI